MNKRTAIKTFTVLSLSLLFSTTFTSCASKDSILQLEQNQNTQSKKIDSLVQDVNGILEMLKKLELETKQKSNLTEYRGLYQELTALKEKLKQTKDDMAIKNKSIDEHSAEIQSIKSRLDEIEKSIIVIDGKSKKPSKKKPTLLDDKWNKIDNK